MLAADMAEILAAAIETVCAIPRSAVHRAATLDDLAIDSLAVAELIVEVELQVGCEFPVHVLRQLDGLRSVGDVADALAAAVGDAGGSSAEPAPAAGSSAPPR